MPKVPDIAQQVDALDISLFAAIPSQTTAPDRRMLLAVQRATARKHGSYVYLEIGSHLGGSLQPHVLDSRCAKIYSIDPRPAMQPDDRSPGYVHRYEGNSTPRMLDLLRELERGDTAKIECFDKDAEAICPGEIGRRPHIAFIDGEHTKEAVLRDYRFCAQVLAGDGAILFHDFNFIYPAIMEIRADLEAQRRPHDVLRLDGSLCAIFFDTGFVASDVLLAEVHTRNRHYLDSIHFRLFRWRKALKRHFASRRMKAP